MTHNLDFKIIEQEFPYECKTTYHFEQVVPWCEKHFGDFNDRWYRYGTDIALGIVAGAPPYDIYRFRDEGAAVLFKLKWS